MLDSHVGYLAGLTTSVCWTASSLFFNAASRRVGVISVNALRMVVAAMLLALAHRWLSGAWLPSLHGKQVALLALSGLLGLTIGDQAVLTAFVRIGPRITLLLMTTAPLFAAALGWGLLGERLQPRAGLGIALTLAGVAWVILERNDSSPAQRPHWLSGVLLAILGAACQAGGLLLSKQGIGHGWLPAEARLSPDAAAFTRMVFGAAAGLVIMAIARRARGVAGADELPTLSARRAGYAFALAGAVAGPFLGMWMSLVASDRVPLGVAQTLCSLPPILILPFAARLHGEKITPRSIGGAAVAVVGAALLF